MIEDFFTHRVLGFLTEIKLTGVFEVRFYTIEWGRRRVDEGRKRIGHWSLRDYVVIFFLSFQIYDSL